MGRKPKEKKELPVGMLTMEGAAEYLGCTVSNVYKLLKSPKNDLVSFKCYGLKCIWKRDLMKYKNEPVSEN